MRQALSLGLLVSTELFGLLLFVFAAGFPPFDDAAEVDLTTHMVQHFLIVLSGILVAYPRYGRGLLKTGRRGTLPLLLLAGTAVLTVFWHLPVPWDEAVLNPVVHVVEHLCFLLVGLMCGSWLLLLSDSGKIGALTAAFFGHMSYGAILISPWNVQVYALYSLADQVILGWALILTGPFVVTGIAYVIARNPDWLGGFSNRPKGAGPRETFLNRFRTPRWVSPLASVILVIAFLGYFAGTAYALGTSPGSPQGGAVVYIVETPVSWNYSPRDITVVLGVNSTVTWVSRSISYDTVTSRNGSFASQAIAPGGTFSYTFTSPGVYEYYCLYHPWMTGSVTVLPK